MRIVTAKSQRAECLDCELASDATASFTRAHAASTGHTATFVFERMATYHGETEQQLDHLAQRAEGDYASGLGDRMRELVDYERSARAVAL